MSALPWRCRELSSRWAASVAARAEHCYSTAVERVNPGEGASPSQAARLGVRVGWVIVAVDGVDAAGIGHDELLARVQKISLSTGPPGRAGTHRADESRSGGFTVRFLRRAAPSPGPPGDATPAPAPQLATQLALDHFFAAAQPPTPPPPAAAPPPTPCTAETCAEKIVREGVAALTDAELRVLEDALRAARAARVQCALLGGGA